MTGSRIRRQVYELTPTDLERFPVWEFALDEEGAEGQDEATVRPYEVNGTLDPNAGMFIVRAALTLADGTRLTGYLTPPVQGETGISTFQPAVVTPNGQVTFWCGMMEPSADFIAGSYARLGKASAKEVFPIRFESEVDLACGPITGELPGFLVMEDFATRRARVVV